MTEPFRVVVIGMGVQGAKRKLHAGKDFVAGVELGGGHEYKDVKDVPLSDYDAALVCVPDAPKIELLEWLVANNKHVLVEKPLWSANDAHICALEGQAQQKSVVVYTAYNHRFEPHFKAMKDLIASGRLGPIYCCRLFYGNGTARLVRDSDWRDQGSGVLHDLGSHLLDTAAFWFGRPSKAPRLISANAFENRAPDHVVIGVDDEVPKLEMEMTLLSWRNHFTADVFAQNGSAHIESLCKWGPTNFAVRERVLPSGRPRETVTTLVQDDPTWHAEYQDFKSRCLHQRTTDLAGDLWLSRTLRRLGQDAVDRVATCQQ